MSPSGWNRPHNSGCTVEAELVLVLVGSPEDEEILHSETPRAMSKKLQDPSRDVETAYNPDGLGAGQDRIGGGEGDGKKG